MRHFRQFILAISLFASSTIFVQARPASEAEVKLLGEATSAYANALQTADFDSILNAIPPRIVEKLAEQSKIAPEQFRQIMINQMKQLSNSYKVVQIAINQTKKRAGEFEDGTPYFIMPLDFTILANGSDKSRIKGELVAILDNDKWYFVRGDDAATLSTMNAAFPGFEKIKLSAPQVSKVE
ncbi:hypothetical protein [Bartonella sp. LJL80]